MGETKIEWADKVWNPVTGCTKISVGCANCYAERMSKRLAANPTVKHRERYEDFKVSLHPDRLDQPSSWRKPRRIFVCSMGDLFHEDVPFDFIEQVWWPMYFNPRHQYLVLTKRPERMAEFIASVANRPGCYFASSSPWTKVIPP